MLASSHTNSGAPLGPEDILVLGNQVELSWETSDHAEHVL